MAYGVDGGSRGIGIARMLLKQDARRQADVPREPLRQEQARLERQLRVAVLRSRAYSGGTG